MRYNRFMAIEVIRDFGIVATKPSPDKISDADFRTAVKGMRDYRQQLLATSKARESSPNSSKTPTVKRKI